MTALRTFRLQFLESPVVRARPALLEGSLAAADLDMALMAVARVPWPIGANACRLTDLESREVAYRFGRGERPAMFVRFAIAASNVHLS